MEGTTATAATVITAFTNGFSTISGNVMDLIGAAAPIAIGIAAVLFISRRAMGWFKGMAK